MAPSHSRRGIQLPYHPDFNPCGRVEHDLQEIEPRLHASGSHSPMQFELPHAAPGSGRPIDPGDSHRRHASLLNPHPSPRGHSPYPTSPAHQHQNERRHRYHRRTARPAPSPFQSQVDQHPPAISQFSEKHREPSSSSSLHQRLEHPRKHQPTPSQPNRDISCPCPRCTRALGDQSRSTRINPVQGDTEAESRQEAIKRKRDETDRHPEEPQLRRHSEGWLRSVSRAAPFPASQHNRARTDSRVAFEASSNHEDDDVIPRRPENMRHKAWYSRYLELPDGIGQWGSSQLIIRRREEGRDGDVVGDPPRSIEDSSVRTAEQPVSIPLCNPARITGAKKDGGKEAQLPERRREQRQRREGHSDDQDDMFVQQDQQGREQMDEEEEHKPLLLDLSHTDGTEQRRQQLDPRPGPEQDPEHEDMRRSSPPIWTRLQNDTWRRFAEGLDEEGRLGRWVMMHGGGRLIQELWDEGMREGRREFDESEQQREMRAWMEMERERLEEEADAEADAEEGHLRGGSRT